MLDNMHFFGVNYLLWPYFSFLKQIKIWNNQDVDQKYSYTFYCNELIFSFLVIKFFKQDTSGHVRWLGQFHCWIVQVLFENDCWCTLVTMKEQYPVGCEVGRFPCGNQKNLRRKTRENPGEEIMWGNSITWAEDTLYTITIKASYITVSAETGLS